MSIKRALNDWNFMPRNERSAKNGMTEKNKIEKRRKKENMVLCDFGIWGVFA